MTDIVNGLLLRNHRVLMAHRSPLRRNYPDSWSFPGGHVESGETIEHALVRELSEEIGITAKSWRFIKSFNDLSTDPSHPVRFHIFVVSDWDGEPAIIGDEHTEIRWVALEDAKQLQDLTFPAYAELFDLLAQY